MAIFVEYEVYVQTIWGMPMQNCQIYIYQFCRLGGFRLQARLSARIQARFLLQFPISIKINFKWNATCTYSKNLTFYQFWGSGGLRMGQKRNFPQILRRTVGSILFYISHNKSVERINRSSRG